MQVAHRCGKARTARECFAAMRAAAQPVYESLQESDGGQLPAAEVLCDGKQIERCVRVLTNLTGAIGK
jgi:hypothetical protein